MAHGRRGPTGPTSRPADRQLEPTRGAGKPAPRLSGVSCRWGRLERRAPGRSGPATTLSATARGGLGARSYEKRTRSVHGRKRHWSVSPAARSLGLTLNVAVRAARTDRSRHVRRHAGARPIPVLRPARGQGGELSGPVSTETAPFTSPAGLDRGQTRNRDGIGLAGPECRGPGPAARPSVARDRSAWRRGGGDRRVGARPPTPRSITLLMIARRNNHTHGDRRG